jgi:initiation factor 1A
MVRNVTGGSKHKSQARKNVVPRGGASGALRVAQEEGECFAQVERMLGGSNCHVKCVDGIVRLCVIRGKFRGKGKRDNVLSLGSIVLVGMRDYESCKGKDKLETCDLLEVYREADKTRLFSSVKIDWSEIVTAPGCAGEKVSAASSSEGGEDFAFMTDSQIEMERLMKEQEEDIIARSKFNTIVRDDTPLTNSQPDNARALFGDEDVDVDVDDI